MTEGQAVTSEQVAISGDALIGFIDEILNGQVEWQDRDREVSFFDGVLEGAEGESRPGRGLLVGERASIDAEAFHARIGALRGMGHSVLFCGHENFSPSKRSNEFFSFCTSLEGVPSLWVTLQLRHDEEQDREYINSIHVYNGEGNMLEAFRVFSIRQIDEVVRSITEDVNINLANAVKNGVIKPESYACVCQGFNESIGEIFANANVGRPQKNRPETELTP